MTSRGVVRLGDTVRDSITKLTGTVVAITEWLNGCERITVQPRELKDHKPVESTTFDVEQLEVVKSRSRPVLRKTGGPHPEPTRN